MRVAVLLVGNIRTMKSCVASLKYFLSNLDADIFVSTYDLKYGYHPCVRQSTGLISDENLTVEEVNEVLEPLFPCTVVVDDHQRYFERKVLEIGKGFHSHEYGSLMQFFKIEDALSLILERELSHGFCYDALIKTRCDLTYVEKAPLDKLSDDGIVVDNGNVFPNDCVILGKRMPMERMIRNMASICRTTNDRTDCVTQEIPHGILAYAAQREDLKISSINIMRGVVRCNGEIPYPPLPSILRRQP